MNSVLLLMADAPPPATIREALELLFTGVTLVFAALIMVLGMIIVMRKLTPEDGAGGSTPPPPKAPPASSAQKPKSDDDIDGAVLAAIAAAVLVAVKQPVRITRVRFLADQQGRGAWALRGRSEIHSSHRIRKG